MANKYNAKKTEYNGQLYDSRAEAAYAQQLDIEKKIIGNERVIEIIRQPKYPIEINGIKICIYKGDFLVTYQSGESKLIDVKGYRTRDFIIKKKLVEAVHGIKIIEVNQKHK